MQYYKLILCTCGNCETRIISVSANCGLTGKLYFGIGSIGSSQLRLTGFTFRVACFVPGFRIFSMENGSISSGAESKADKHGHDRLGQDKNGPSLWQKMRTDNSLSQSFLEGTERDQSIEAGFEEKQIPPWWDQITVRGLVVSAVLGGLFCIITHKLNLTVGVIPSLNVAAGLLGFFLIKTWKGFLSKIGIWSKPFTPQENTVIQTCVVACYGLAFSGGFGTYLLSLDKRTYDLIGPNYPGNRIQDVKNPSLGWMIAFTSVVSFLGIMALVPLRKVMIIDYRLTYPSGTATAVLINSFHTTEGAETAQKQVKSLGKFFAMSLFWSFFKWFFSGIGDSCGFDNFPTLGLKAYANTFYFDFSTTYVGVGMICPHIVNCSVLFGAIISWGILWPIIGSRAGDWYPGDLGKNDFKGLYGYKVFIAIALILGDGLYNLLKIVFISSRALHLQHEESQQLPIIDTSNEFEGENELEMTEEKQKHIFLQDYIPFWVAVSGYVTLSVISMIAIPKIFLPVRWYHVLVAYVIAPTLGFCNSYGCGLTDWSLASTYGKLGLFIFAAWVGSHGGVVAGLAICGVMMSIVSTAADLMQDLRTGLLTLSSPRSMFVSQLLGTAMGCILAPLTFWMFWSAFNIGAPDGEYKAPYAVIFRQMAILGVEGLSGLPKYCLEFCCAFFILALFINLIRDVGPKPFSQYIPIPMAMAIPFYIGAYFAIDMFVGTVILFVWEYLNKNEADVYSPAVASGLICGDGVWTIPSAVLALAKINPPICMAFSATKPSLGL